ncbi:MAG: AI-2E family transporter [Eubacterium sp.]|nr:AI-2E family transporter [Eubacterium sp.]
MKKLSDKQKRYFYIGLTLFISLSLVVIVSNFFTRAHLIVNLILSIISALSSVWIGLVIAYVMSPAVGFFERNVFLKLFKGKKGLARALSVTLSIILLIAFLATLLIIVIPQLITTLGTLVKNLPAYYNNLRNFICGFFDNNSAIGSKVVEFFDGGYDKLISWMQQEVIPNANILGTATDALLSAAGILVDFFVGVIISIYLLCDKENYILRARKGLASIFSEKWYTRIMTFCSEAHHVFGEFLIGKILDSLLVGVVTFVFMWVAKMPYATLVSVLLAVCNLIPFFGMFIGMIPSFLLILVIDPVKAIIWLVVIVIYMQIDGNVISPKILGNSIGLGSFWILFSIILFGGMFGILGMLFGVPVFAMLYKIVKRALDRKLHKKGLPTEAYEYGGSSPTFPDRKHRRKLREENEGHIVEKIQVPAMEVAPEPPDEYDDENDDENGSRSSRRKRRKQ